MRALPQPILSANLKAEQIPVIRDWTDVIEFSKTFRQAVEFPAGCIIRGLSDIGNSSDIREIRAALFAEYRRYNHFGHHPSVEVLDEARAAVERIRRQLT